MRSLSKRLNIAFDDRISLSVFLLLSTFLCGCAGYVWIEDYSWLEAVYMTVITVSTVGYTEVRTLSDSGRIFTAILIVCNLIAFTYAFTNLTSYIYDGEFVKNLLRKRMNNRIKTMRNHVVVCGYGRIGRQVCDELHIENLPFVVIEKNEEIILNLQRMNNYLFIEGEATDDNVLKSAGLERASALIATLPSDSDNVYITLAAREICPNLKIISRVTNEMSESKLRRAGCTHTILPERISGSHMAALVSHPDLYRFINYLIEPGNSNVYFEQLFIKEEAVGGTMGDLDVRRKTGVTVIGIKLPNGNYIINPSVDHVIEANSVLFVLGSKEQISLCKKDIQAST